MSEALAILPELSPAAPAPVPAPVVAGASSLHADVAHSLGNAVKLGASLLATWSVALGVRLVLPRWLGPEMFGAFQFADSFATTALILTNLGVETYVRKEIATRPAHASEFFGGVLALRIVLSVVVGAAAVVALGAAGKPPLVLMLVCMLALTQAFVIANATFAALLHAVGRVDGLSLLNVGSKVVWGLGIAVALLTHGGVRSIAAALLVSEVLKAAFLTAITRRHLTLRVVLRVGPTLAVLAASLPFYLSTLSQTIYERVDITFISFLAGDREAGWYSAAQNLAGMSLLLSPLIWWVLLPLAARARERSEEEFTQLMRRAMEMVLVAAIPVTLFLGLASREIVLGVFGTRFAPAVGSLRLLAPMFVLTYANMVASSVLVRIERGWVVTFSLVSGLVVSIGLNWLLVRRAHALLGDGGAGIGAAVALVTTEAYVAGVVLYAAGRRIFDRRGVTMLVKNAAISLAVVVVDHLLLRYGIARFAVDVTLYCALVVSTRTVRVGEIVQFVRNAVARQRGDHAAAA